jgi:cell division protein FtsB
MELRQDIELIGQGSPHLECLLQDLDRLNSQVQRLKDENALMLEQTRRLRDDRDALEETARRDLGLMKPGEKLFIVKDLPPPP